MTLSTYYGPNYICDLGEISTDMLPYTRQSFEGYFEGTQCKEILSSDIWYEERSDFSRKAIGTDRIFHREQRGYELIQGSGEFSGYLLGGCLESLYDILTTNRYLDEKDICDKYQIFPRLEEWREKILFLETCEEKPTPELLEKELLVLKSKGVFDVVNGILVGKPQDEAYYNEYKEVYKKVIDNNELPILYNINFGHATPRCVLQYGAYASVSMKTRSIKIKMEEKK